MLGTIIMLQENWLHWFQWSLPSTSIKNQYIEFTWGVNWPPSDKAKFTRLLRDLLLKKISNKSRYIRLKDFNFSYTQVETSFGKSSFKNRTIIFIKNISTKNYTNSSWTTDNTLTFVLSPIIYFSFSFNSVRNKPKLKLQWPYINRDLNIIHCFMSWKGNSNLHSQNKFISTVMNQKLSKAKLLFKKGHTPPQQS